MTKQRDRQNGKQTERETNKLTQIFHSFLFYNWNDKDPTKEGRRAKSGAADDNDVKPNKKECIQDMNEWILTRVSKKIYSLKIHLSIVYKLLRGTRCRF